MNVDVDGALIETAAARDQTNDTTDIAADITEITDRKTVSHEPANDSVLSQGHDLEIFRVVLFEISQHF